MNVRLLRKVAKHIEKEPRRLNMGFYAAVDHTGEEAPPCGTIGCIAGWASILTGTKPDDADDRTGRAALKLTLQESRLLFWTSGWPAKFHRRYYNAPTPRAAARATIARIEHFIKTKGKE